MLSRRFFTLLELLVVFVLIACAAAITGIKINGLYREQQFLSESKEVANHLAMAQDLMLLMDTDVWVRLRIDREKGLSVKMEVERPIQEHWTKLIERTLLLPSIKEMHFNGRNEKVVNLQFSLDKMSQGQLKFYGQKKEESQEIILPGYPIPIGEKMALLDSQDIVSRSENLYPTFVYQKLYEKKNK